MASAAPTIARQFTRDSSFDSSDLPPEISGDVPYCAQQCLIAYVKQAYTCNSTSFACLCTTYGAQNFTLGELALGCLDTRCSEPSQASQITLYNLCSTQSGAVVPIHSTLTLPPLSSTASSSPVTSATLSPSSTVSFTTSSQVTLTASASTSASPATQSSQLSTAAAIGISVGAMGLLMATIAIIMLVRCLRRRRDFKRKPPHDSYDFVDEAPSAYAPVMAQRLRHNVFPNGATSQAPAAKDKRVTAWPGRTLSRVSAELRRWSKSNNDIGVQQQAYKRSRRSAESTRTVSQLLPVKPELSLVKTKDNATSPDPESPGTVIEDDPMSPRLIGSHTQQLQSPPKVYRVTNASPPDQHQMPGKDFQPSLLLDIPKLATRNPPMQKQGLPRNPRDVPAAHAHKSIEDNVPAYYYSSDTSQERSRKPSTSSSEAGRQRRKVAPAPIRVTHPTAPPIAVRTSPGSDTSFESDDSPKIGRIERHENTRSPTAAVRYPQVPKPTPALSILHKPRAPPITPEQRQPYPRPPQNVFTPPDSRQGSPLSSARNKASRDLELRSAPVVDSAHNGYPQHSPSPATRVAQSSATKRYNQQVGAQASPLRNYGRAAPASDDKETEELRAPPRTLNRRSQEASALGSPMAWGSRLTPRRYGDDMFLSVDTATPR